MNRFVLVALALAASSPAFALDAYMWGVGPKIGTNIIPGHYPGLFPKVIRNDETATLEEFRDDVTFGVEGVYYVNGHTRTLVSAGLGFARRYFDRNIILKYNYVGQTGAMDFLFGGGLGVGMATFRGEGEERLTVPYYPFRAEGSALIRDDMLGYQLGLYAQYNLPSSHQYQDQAGLEVEDVHGGVYGTIGAEIAVYFGDFTPPKRKKGGGAED